MPALNEQAFFSSYHSACVFNKQNGRKLAKLSTIKKSTLAYTIKDDDRAIFARLSRSHQNQTAIIHFLPHPNSQAV